MGRLRCGRKIRGQQGPVAEESDGGKRRSDMYRQLDQHCHCVLGNYSVEDQLENIPRCDHAASVDPIKAGG